MHPPSLRHSLDFVSYGSRMAVAAAVKDIYPALDPAAGEAAPTAFEAGSWGAIYPAIGMSLIGTAHVARNTSTAPDNDSSFIRSFARAARP